MRHRTLVAVLGVLYAGVVSSCCGSRQSPPPGPASGAITATPACTAGSSARVPVALRGQEASLWCWAAAGQMVMETLGRGPTQCTQVRDAHGGACTCAECSVTSCNRGGFPDFHRYGFDAKRTADAPLAWATLQEQFACKRVPVVFSWHFGAPGEEGGGGHVLVANGYNVTGGDSRWVRVIDPWPPCQGDTYFLPYQDYQGIEGEYYHWDDFYDLSYRGVASP